MKIPLTLLVIALLTACASKPAHKLCEQRLVPINVPAPVSEASAEAVAGATKRATPSEAKE